MSLPFKKLTDEDVVGFGKYKDTKLANVPASYLLFIHKNYKINPNLRVYINENRDLLKKEAEAEYKARLKERDRGLINYPEPDDYYNICQ